MLVKKVFQLVKPLLANLHSSISKKCMCYLHLSIKNTQCIVLVPIFKFFVEKVFRSCKHFLKFLKKHNSQETDFFLKFQKHILQKCIRITFYTYIPVNPYHFLKKHHNRSKLTWNFSSIIHTWRKPRESKLSRKQSTVA